MKTLPLLALFFLASCGGGTTESPSSDETTRPVRIEGHAPEPTTAPVRVASPEEQASAPPTVTSDALAEPPPVEPP